MTHIQKLVEQKRLPQAKQAAENLDVITFGK